jgi:hypothetical protein
MRFAEGCKRLGEWNRRTVQHEGNDMTANDVKEMTLGAGTLPSVEEMKKVNGQIRMALWFISQMGSIERARRIFDAAVRQAAMVNELAEQEEEPAETKNAP